MILSTDLIIKLKKLFIEKKFTEIEFSIESLGELKKLPNNVLNLYAVSKALNPNSKIDDFKLSAYCFEKIYLADKSNREVFYNLIVASVKAVDFTYLEKHLIEEHRKDKNQPIIGANDGASGVAVILELAKILGENAPQVGVNLVMFDGEEKGAKIVGTDPESDIAVIKIEGDGLSLIHI